MSERRFRLIGDPHITRKFEMNVPLARRGEREASLFAEFNTRLYAGEEHTVVMVGDLFEKPICSLKDAFTAYQMVLGAAEAQPHRDFIMMAGNHDVSPQQDNPGAFDILKLFDGMLSNLFIVTTPFVWNDIAFFPWQWDRTALEQLEDVRGQQFDMAVGHWDLVAYDENHTEHLCPAAELKAMGAKEIYSGHWHIKGDYWVDGVTVHCTGSMQPMTHAEDPDGNLYVTLSLEEYEDADPETLKDKYVRVVVEGDAEVDALADCLGFKVQRKSAPEWDDGGVEVGEFKVTDIIQKNLEKHKVPDEVGAFIKERIDANS